MTVHACVGYAASLAWSLTDDRVGSTLALVAMGSANASIATLSRLTALHRLQDN